MRQSPLTGTENDQATREVADFATTAKSLAKNPLGIVALFIVLVYMMASVALIAAGDHKSIIVWFLVLFPVLVLFVFAWLVVRHHDKLYAPEDYRDEQNYMRVVANLWAADKKLKIPISGLISSAGPRNTGGGFRHATNPVRSRILWVDDKPENNQHERDAFEAVGLQVSLALSTSEALERLAQGPLCCHHLGYGPTRGPP